MPKLPVIEKVADLRPGENPSLDAWMYHFLTENNIEHLLNPSIVASFEQLSFMVALAEDQVYLPCDDELFLRIYQGRTFRRLYLEYLKAWRFIVGLVRTYRMSRDAKRRVLSLCRYRFRLFYTERMILPSRMIKRLVNIVLTQSGDHDPFRDKKQLANRNAAALLWRTDFQDILQRAPQSCHICDTIPAMRWELDLTEMSRLLIFSTLEAIWNGQTTLGELADEMENALERCACLRDIFPPQGEGHKKILFIPDVAGGFMFDIALMFSLLRQGHQIILALKDAFYFNSPTIWDREQDDLIKVALEKARMVTNDHTTKNELLQVLRENRFIIISDGTSEQLNLYRTSVTFARAWKESDVVIAKGRRNRATLLGSSHEFTRDILCYWRDQNGEFHIARKPRAAWVRKFSEGDILTMAKGLILKMREEKEKGKTIMFYSAIIGSIPGQTKVALQVVNTFVAHLRDRLDNTHIINPAEHFEEGMDGDDLMYMWEQVQRSGLLDVWRFQTVDDIEASFALMGKKIPSVWSGKDSTFSTGCTKEMRIALDVQRIHPELQIIGPAGEKFFRRRDYGVGKYFDATLKG